MVIEGVSGILIHLQPRQWARATSDVEDRLVDTWVSRWRSRETVAKEICNLGISAVQSPSQSRSRYRKPVSSQFSLEKYSEMFVEEGFHTWRIQGAKGEALMLFISTNHSSLGEWLEHMTLFPDLIATNSFCADRALLYDVNSIRLDLL